MAAALSMDWLPPAPDFRGDLRRALAAPDPAERLQRLTVLAAFRLGYVESIQLDRAIPASGTAPAGYAGVRVALLSSSTVEHLRPAIRVAGLRRRLLIDLHIGAYGQHRQTLLEPSAALRSYAPDFVILSLSARDAIAGIPLAISSSEAEQAVGRVVADLRALWSKARANLGATVIQQTYLDVTDPLFGSCERLVSGAPASLIARLNERLAEAASNDAVLLLDVARASAAAGIDAWFDRARWFQGKLEISPAASALYGELASRVIGAQLGRSRKCLVLDLDNTLWGGVVGDDGLEGIVLGEGDAAGEAHLGLQRYVKALGERGVILAICSKNDASTAESVFEQHPDMILRRRDIAAFVANWNDKAANLAAIAEQLNIGLDSLVFVDDSPAERARVREALPMVAVPEMPADVANYARCLSEAGYFEAIAFTDDDRSRVEQYAANAERDVLRGQAQSLESFLRGLQMSLEYGPVTPLQLARASQLINKTNQFNPTTRRFTLEQLSKFVGEPENVALRFRLVDRFGDNGIVSVVLLCPVAGERDALEIDTWVMSCRVFGRQLEDEVMNIVVEQSARRGARSLRGTFMPTPKNGVVARLYAALGFSPVDQDPAAGAATSWRLDLAGYARRATFIQRLPIA